MDYVLLEETYSTTQRKTVSTEGGRNSKGWRGVVNSKDVKAQPI